jgi:hypothetical protein
VLDNFAENELEIFEETAIRVYGLGVLRDY